MYAAPLSKHNFHEESNVWINLKYFLFPSCSCNSGFVVESDDQSRCADINECLTVSSRSRWSESDFHISVCTLRHHRHVGVP